eukprot:XP_027302751.1 uncharacterized protein LOC113840305 [Anas platyrhynchos]
MATEADVTCPVCQGTTKEPSVVIPCRHQFCLGCIMRWAARNATCPLCRQKITSVRYSIWAEDDFMEVQIIRPAEPQNYNQQDEQEAAVPVPQPVVSGLLPEQWAALFRDHPTIISPLRPWVRQQARELFGAAWWQQDMLEANVVAWLCLFGLHEQALVGVLQPFLQGHTMSFVQQLIARTVEMCINNFIERLRLLEPPPASQQRNSPEVDIEGSQDSSEAEDSPAATPSPAASPRATPVISELSSSSPESSDTEELPSTSSAALRGDPGHPATAPDLTEQEEPCSEPGLPAQEDAAVPGCSHGLSPPGQDRDRSSARPRRAPKRRANSSPDSPQPCKRPPPRRR